MGKTKVLPPIDNKILLMTAVELAEKIRKRQLSCEEIMRAYVERSSAVHEYVNAVVDERYEDALQEAKAVDAMLAKTTKSEDEIARDTPLLGVPFSCKEAIGVKGLAQTSGLVRAKDRLCPKDSDAAATYRKAGGIPYAVTNVPELCMWWESANHVFGLTKNPYDHTRSVGGSSGGEGAIIAAGAAVIGIGNDIAGSIRIPASFCGIYGHKPSRDLISNMGCFPDSDDEFDQFVSTGPMCRYAQDLVLLTRILSNNSKKVNWNAKVDFRKVKIYYMEEIPDFLQRSTPDIKRAMKKATKHFEDEYGVTAIHANIKEMAYAFNMWECKLLECGGPSFKSALAPEGKINLHWELFKCLFGCSDHTLPAIYFGMVDRREKDKFYYKCLEKYNDLKRKFEEMLQGDAIFLLPTQCEPPMHYLTTIPKYPNIGYTCIFSILGYPSTQIPAGFSDGVPIGIQAISRQYQDHLTLAAGLELDKVFGGWVSPSPVTD
ncbi:fatty-acid amide hydrolase 2-B [Caerostris darwini]|uniref:Fatty-acid amide hydrolase 2-B n=1 Tax=Caerostris darwini TaxID=1538125 RepID=A0AAV4V2Y0_9ARAC|nr:fatty-acid amide hydrolase 2-B [Caerostris darwini]